MDQRENNSGKRPPRPAERPIRYDENGRPIPPRRRPVRYDENGRPIPPKKRPVRYDENGRPIPPKKRPVRYDENGRPIPPKKRPARYDENGNPIPARRAPVASGELVRRPRVQNQTEIEEQKRRAAQLRRKKEEEEKQRRQGRRSTFILAIQVIASIACFVMILLLNMLPTKYLALIALVLILLLGTSLLLQRSKRVRGLGIAFSLLLSVVLLMGSVYLGKAYSVMGNITKGQQQVSHDKISVIVPVRSDMQKLADLSGGRVGIQKTTDRGNTEAAMQQIKAQAASVRQKEYQSLKAQIGALYNGEIDAIVLNEMYRSLVLEEFKNFDQETRVLETFSFEQQAIEEEEKKDVQVHMQPFTVYLSGNDEWGEVSTENGRADVNIIATVNPTTKQVLLTTVPRDYYVELPFYGEGEYLDKLTHAGMYGMRTSMRTLEKLLDTQIDYYVRINFSGFQNIVEALGGVRVYSEQSFTSIDGKEFVKGYNDLNGYEALLFVRERYAFENGDVQRGRNQMAMIQALMDKIFSPTILTNYMGLMDSLSSCFVTDMPQSKIGDLVRMQLEDGAEWKIVSNSLTGYAADMGTYSYGASEYLSVILPDEKDVENAKALIQACINGEELRVGYKDYSLRYAGDYPQVLVPYYGYDSYNSEYGYSYYDDDYGYNNSYDSEDSYDFEDSYDSEDGYGYEEVDEEESGWVSEEDGYNSDWQTDTQYQESYASQ